MPKDGYYIAHAATLGNPSCGVAILSGAVIGIEYGDRHHVSCMFGCKYMYDGLKYTPVSVHPDWLKKRADENFRDIEPGESIVVYA